VTPRRAVALAAGAILTLLAVLAAAAPPSGLAVHVTPERPRPGDVVLVRIHGAPPDVAGEWNGRPLPLFPVAGGVAAVVGVDLETPPGPLRWRLFRPAPAGGRVSLGAGAVTVGTRQFETQHLTLPPGQVDLDPPTLARVKVEQAEMAAALAGVTAERLWHGPFVKPVDGGRETGGFGLRRIINKQPRSPHSGYDWAAPRGTPVLAANAGRVALVADYFFAGRLVVLDHGLGLFTHYYHLDEARVAVGDAVVAGQPIGVVGASGRATGPHLHLGVYLAGARVDPLSLLGLALPED